MEIFCIMYACVLTRKGRIGLEIPELEGSSRGPLDVTKEGGRV